jgi:hypothetical protein
MTIPSSAGEHRHGYLNSQCSSEQGTDPPNTAPASNGTKHHADSILREPAKKIVTIYIRYKPTQMVTAVLMAN